MATDRLAGGQTIESDDNNGEGWVCDWVTPESGEVCGEWFATRFRYGRHRKSHVTKPCGKCGKLFSRNGHTQHERSCRGAPVETVGCGGVPWDALQAQLAEFQSHALDAPVSGVYVCTPMRSAFMSPTAAVHHAVELVANGVVTVIAPSALVVPPQQAQRWRRITPELLPKDPTPARAARPARPSPVLVGLAAWSPT